jgi:hypothetical protein
MESLETEWCPAQGGTRDVKTRSDYGAKIIRTARAGKPLDCDFCQANMPP